MRIFRFIMAAMAFGASLAGAQERFGRSSGIVLDDDVLQTSQPSAPVRPAAATLSTQTIPTSTAPAAVAPVTGTGRGCIPSRPYQASTPLKITVDQQRQVMTVESPDFPQPMEFPVSTGGGLKIPSPGPDGKAKDPYYACTPEMKDKIITGFEPSEFANRPDCKPEDVRSRSTMFIGDTYRSQTFTTEDGQGVVMPNALRVSGGIFIHRVPPSYKKLIGRNVSGECIRVPGWHRAPDWIQHLQRQSVDTTALSARDVRRKVNGRTISERQIEISETLYKQMKKHGAIQVTITPPPDAVCHLPKEERRARALADAARMPKVPSTGTEGVAGGVENFFNNLANLFGNTGSRPKPAAAAPSSGTRPSPPKPPKPSKPGSDGRPEWAAPAFNNG